MGNIVTTDFLDATFKSFRALFTKTFSEYVPEFDRLVERVNSGTLTETYLVPSSLPKMREWKDERQPAGLAEISFVLKNLHFESSVAVDKDTLADDQLDRIRPRIQELALSARKHMARTVLELIKDGASKTCWDGQYYFDTDHVWRNSGVQSNKLTGTGVTVDKLKDDFTSVRTNFLRLKDDEGEPMGLVPDLIVCPPELEIGFRELLNASIISSTGNVMVNIADLLVNPYLTDTNDWYAFNTKMPSKPFIFQMRQDVEFAQMASPDGTEAFMRKKLLYGVDARYNAGYSMWQLACMVTNT